MPCPSNCTLQPVDVLSMPLPVVLSVAVTAPALSSRPVSAQHALRCCSATWLSGHLGLLRRVRRAAPLDLLSACLQIKRTGGTAMLPCHGIPHNFSVYMQCMHACGVNISCEPELSLRTHVSNLPNHRACNMHFAGTALGIQPQSTNSSKLF